MRNKSSRHKGERFTIYCFGSTVGERPLVLILHGILEKDGEGLKKKKIREKKEEENEAS